ncbi:hypothetical protein D3C80_1538090 [compost metagenome]
MGHHVRDHVLHFHGHELLHHLHAHDHHNVNAVFPLDEHYNFHIHGYAQANHIDPDGYYKKCLYNHGHKSKTNQH